MTTTQTPEPAGQANPEPIQHAALLSTAEPMGPASAPLCGGAGPTAEVLEQTTCPACLAVLAGSTPAKHRSNDYEKPNGTSVRTPGPDDKEHERLRRSYCTPKSTWLWTPEDAIEFTPVLSDVIYGDGESLWAFTTTENRPAYWIIRGDSSWRVDDDSGEGPLVGDFADHIIMNLIIEFGDGEPDPEGDQTGEPNEDGLPYPAIDASNGCSWRRLTKPADAVR